MIGELFYKSKLCRKIKQLKENFKYVGNKGGLIPLNKDNLGAKVDPPTHTEANLSGLLNDTDKDKCTGLHLQVMHESTVMINYQKGNIQSFL